MDYTEKLCAFYESEGREELRFSKSGVHYLEYLTATKYLDKFLRPSSKILDSCAGSGAYSFYLAGKGHKVTAGDIVPYNVEIMRKKQPENPRLDEIYLGDALDLGRFADESFDAVLLMGALYHFGDPGDRKRAVDESVRLLKDGGLFFCTYMNRHAVIYNNASGSLDDIDEIMRFLSDGKEGVFYASTPAEITALMESGNIGELCHVALDGMACLMSQTSGLLDEKGLERWRQYHFATCEEPYLLGCSYHNMFIGKKK